MEEENAIRLLELVFARKSSGVMTAVRKDVLMTVRKMDNVLMVHAFVMLASPGLAVKIGNVLLIVELMESVSMDFVNASRVIQGLVVIEKNVLVIVIIVVYVIMETVCVLNSSKGHLVKNENVLIHVLVKANALKMENANVILDFSEKIVHFLDVLLIVIRLTELVIFPPGHVSALKALKEFYVKRRSAKIIARDTENVL